MRRQFQRRNINCFRLFIRNRQFVDGLFCVDAVVVPFTMRYWIYTIRFTYDFECVSKRPLLSVTWRRKRKGTTTGHASEKTWHILNHLCNLLTMMLNSSIFIREKKQCFIHENKMFAFHICSLLWKPNQMKLTHCVRQRLIHSFCFYFYFSHSFWLRCDNELWKKRKHISAAASFIPAHWLSVCGHVVAKVLFINSCEMSECICAYMVHVAATESKWERDFECHIFSDDSFNVIVNGRRHIDRRLRTAFRLLPFLIVFSKTSSQFVIAFFTSQNTNDLSYLHDCRHHSFVW